MSVGTTLSISDLLLVEGFKEAFGKEDTKEIERILWENGLDINQYYTLEFSKHRNLRDNIVSCERYVGEERTDDVWMKSAGCSWENKIEASDYELRVALKTMGATYNNSGHIISELERHSK